MDLFLMSNHLFPRKSPPLFLQTSSPMSWADFFLVRLSCTSHQGNPSCPPQSYPPSNKGLIAGLIKGNQWLIHPKHKGPRLFLRGDTLSGGPAGIPIRPKIPPGHLVEQHMTRSPCIPTGRTQRSIQGDRI